jgi:hypothetical protein
LSFRAEQANFFFLLRSDEEVGLRSRGISLLLVSFNSDALTDPRSLGYHRRGFVNRGFVGRGFSRDNSVALLVGL